MNETIAFNKRAAWEMLLGYIENVIDSDWPESEAAYIGSSWDSWEKRIKNGRDAENETLLQRQKKREAEGYHKDAYFEYADWITEENISMCRLTNSMYAALTVSLWARVETYLRELTWMCYHTISKRESSLKPVSQFINEVLSVEADHQTLKEDIEKLDKLQNDFLCQFRHINDFVNFFKKNLNIKFRESANYKMLNAIRLLNNYFKHNNGKYTPKSNKLDEHIDQTLLTAWSIVDDRGEIDYSKLPIKDLVFACFAFRKELVEKIKKELPRKIKEGGK